jgi:hypothetical protein
MKKTLLILTLFTSLSVTLYAQSLSSYTFSTISSTFTPLSGATNVWSSGDDVTVSNLPIGFNFSYGAPTSAVYSTFCVNSNGWIGLVSNTVPNLTAYHTPGLNSTAISFPVLAALWDDLSIGSGGKVSYLTTGTTGNRILTIEFLNMKWYWGSSSPVISFQIKLYEVDNSIEFIYQPETGTPSSANASIGIKNTTSTDFWSINSNLTSASYGTVTTGIATKPTTGTTFRWVNSNLSTVNTITNAFQIYPNPFSTELNFNFGNDNNKINSISIYNLLGVLVYHKTISDSIETTELKTSINLPKGTYFAKIKGESIDVVKKLICE